MAHPRKAPGLGAFAAVATFLVLASYFSFAAVRGDFGIAARAQVTAEIRVLTAERDRLRAELAGMRIRVTGLSDGTLDADLLDERVRDVLGYVRPDEIVLR